MVLKFEQNYYAGIGSRVLDDNMKPIIVALAEQLATECWILRSGAAHGCDELFEQGCDKVSTKQKQIFLPWKQFNQHDSEWYDPPEKAFDVAKQYHPAWKNLKEVSKKFMARNTQQVLGPKLDEPCSFVVCWTLDGCEHGDDTTEHTGGTGQAIRVASSYNIPIFNLKNPNTIQRLFDFLV